MVQHTYVKYVEKLIKGNIPFNSHFVWLVKVTSDFFPF
jgi:hypothetical protein